MKQAHNYTTYDDYIDYQKNNTENTEKRKTCVNEEHKLKISDFKDSFKRFTSYFNSKKDFKALCIGAGTGQEVISLQELGVDTIGVDIIPCKPHVINGDMHDLQFENNSFDYVYTNVIGHSINPQKMISEIERVLRPDGLVHLQLQFKIHQNEYTEFIIDNPFYDVTALFEQSYCIHMSPINHDYSPNFIDMDFEIIFQKDKNLSALYNKYGTLKTIDVPENYVKIWNDINLVIQTNKLDTANIVDNSMRQEILSGLMKRAYYLTRIAETYKCKNIAEVGTAQGWQFYSFCEYCTAVNGNVVSCDIRDVRDTNYIKKFEEDAKVGTFINTTSDEMAKKINNIDMFYIDGSHEKNAVMNDLKNLIACQTSVDTKPPIWILDDFDIRFGCIADIAQICQMSRKFKVYKVGLTASGQPSHQAIVNARFG